MAARRLAMQVARPTMVAHPDADGVGADAADVVATAVATALPAKARSMAHPMAA